MPRSLAAALPTALAALAVGVAPAHADGTAITVTGTGDPVVSTAACSASGSGFECPSLRDAIDYANANLPGGASITLPAGTVTLVQTDGGTGELSGTVPLTITGAGSGPSGTTIAQTLSDRVITTTADLTLAHVAITGGHLNAAIPSGIAGGGGVAAFAGLTLNDAVVSQNSFTQTATGTQATACGGGVFVKQGLSMTSSTVSHNSVIAAFGLNGSQVNGAPGSGARGGGVCADNFSPTAYPVTISASTISSNTAVAGRGGDATGTAATQGFGGNALGGGVFLAGTNSGPPSTITIDRTTISQNSATGGKGAGASQTGGGGGEGQAALAFLLGWSGHVNSTTIADNVATGGDGGAGGTTGGLAGSGYSGGVELFAGTVAFAQDAFTGNRAVTGAPGSGPTPGAYAGNGFGGGLDAGGNTAIVTIANSTVAGNTVDAGPGATAAGGAGVSASNGSQLHLSSDTIAANVLAHPPAGAGTAVDFEGPGLLTMADTIVAASSSGGSGPCHFSNYSDGGHNLEDDASGSCFKSGTGDVGGADPRLAAAPALNGGPVPTATIALRAGSAALATGGPCTDPLSLPPDQPLGVDQRGLTRPAPCDIGAFQSQPLVVTGAPAITGTPQVGSTITCAAGSFVATGDGPISAATGQVGPVGIAVSWLRDGAPLEGGPSHQVAATDVGQQLTCRMSATGEYGTGQADSGAVTAVAANLPTSAPRLTKVSQSHRRWRTGAKRTRATRAKRRLPVGTTFSFTLNVPARVTLKFSGGTRVASAKCLRNRRSHPGTKPCPKRLTRWPAIKLAGHGGVNKIAFFGRFSTRKHLSPGRYRLTIVAVNAGGSTKNASLSFTVVR